MCLVVRRYLLLVVWVVFRHGTDLVFWFLVLSDFRRYVLEGPTFHMLFISAGTVLLSGVCRQILTLRVHVIAASALLQSTAGFSCTVFGLRTYALRALLQQRLPKSNCAPLWHTRVVSCSSVAHPRVVLCSTYTARLHSTYTTHLHAHPVRVCRYIEPILVPDKAWAVCEKRREEEAPRAQAAGLGG